MTITPKIAPRIPVINSIVSLIAISVALTYRTTVLQALRDQQAPAFRSHFQNVISLSISAPSMQLPVPSIALNARSCQERIITYAREYP